MFSIQFCFVSLHKTTRTDSCVLVSCFSCLSSPVIARVLRQSVYCVRYVFDRLLRFTRNDVVEFLVPIVTSSEIFRNQVEEYFVSRSFCCCKCSRYNFVSFHFTKPLELTVVFLFLVSPVSRLLSLRGYCGNLFIVYVMFWQITSFHS